MSILIPAGVNLKGYTHGAKLTAQEAAELAFSPEFLSGLWIMLASERGGLLLLWAAAAIEEQLELAELLLSKLSHLLVAAQLAQSLPPIES